MRPTKRPLMSTGSSIRQWFSELLLLRLLIHYFVAVCSNAVAWQVLRNYSFITCTFHIFLVVFDDDDNDDKGDVSFTKYAYLRKTHLNCLAFGQFARLSHLLIIASWFKVTCRRLVHRYLDRVATVVTVWRLEWTMPVTWLPRPGPARRRRCQPGLVLPAGAADSPKRRNASGRRWPWGVWRGRSSTATSFPKHSALTPVAGLPAPSRRNSSEYTLHWYIITFSSWLRLFCFNNCVMYR